ncbi:MAG TPA: RbsD/FucU domain-containing protein [Acidimicrobiales bacterium]|nr:RbsD/FucU domain-containing protein [Acidimicrobiales bacterium]
MLKNVDPLLTPDLLFVLAAMGHGDELAIVDANFPGDSVARQTCHGRLLHLAGVAVPEAVRAVLSVLPLDEFVDTPVRRMATGDSNGELPPVQAEVQATIDNAAGRHWPMGELGRFAFYEAAKACYAVVLTSERRLYGNVLIKKGVVVVA